MNNTDLGRVQAYLMRYRMAATQSMRRGVSREEREIATMLRAADPAMIQLLCEILDGQGYVLASMTDLDVKGVPAGGTVFMLARKPDSDAPCFGTERMIARLRSIKSVDTDTAAKTWFVQLWFILLDLIYTRRNRSPNSLQEWVDTGFKKTLFVDCVKEYINDHVRKIDINTLQTDAIYTILTTPKEAGFTQICNAFLELMCEAALLEQIEPEVYRQTLLFAYEIKLNFDRQLAPIFSMNDPLDAASSVLITSNEEA